MAGRAQPQALLEVVIQPANRDAGHPVGSAATSANPILADDCIAINAITLAAIRRDGSMPHAMSQAHAYQPG